jgi:hypothetical protein
MKRACSIVGALALGILAFGATSSHADTKIIPAGLCVDGGPGNFRNGFGTLRNDSFTQGLLALCYIVRDHPSAKPTKIEVSVFDNSSATGNKDIRCHVKVANRFGQVGAAGAVRSTSGTNSAGVVLNLPLPAANHVDGAIIVICEIPRRGVGDPPSGIASIKYVEANERLPALSAR